MNENISKQLISRIITKLSGIKPFIEIRDFNKELDTKYDGTIISLSIPNIEYDLDNYNLVTHLLDNIILSLTENVKTHNYYFIDETMEEDIGNIVGKLTDVNWYVTFDTQMELLQLVDPLEKIYNWIDLKINDKKINTIQSTFPKSVIFGSMYPIIIDPKELNVNGETIIEIPFYYVDDFHAMRLITDERKKKVFLRHKKIKRLRG